MELVTYPNERLRTKAYEVETFPPGFDTLGEIFLRIMRKHDGIALASTQLGHNFKMFVTDLPFPHSMIINPKWEPTPSGFQYARMEGCLSFPGWLAPVKRYDAIRATYQTPSGERVKLVLKELAAQVFQHETDHLDGVLMIDHLTEAQQATLDTALGRKE